MENIQITKDCIQSINNIGSTTYQNICNGNISTVPWGSIDWIIVSVVVIFTTCFIGLMILPYSD